jgi:transmembrane sensor
MKARLRLPLRSTIQDGFDEGDVMRIWRGLRVRRPHPARWWAAGLATASAVALCLAVPRFSTGDRPGPLQLASGGLPGTLVAEQQPQRLVLADRSAIVASPHTTLDVLANDAKLFLTALRRGAIHVQVQPAGPRWWVVECGAVSVEVVGTEFEVVRGPAHVVVSVDRGVVVARGAGVPDHVQRLAAGDRLIIPAVEAATAAPVVAPAATEPEAATPGMGPTPAEAAGVSSRAGSPDDLIRRADVARRAGDLALAKRLLGQAMDTSQGSPAGAVAALTLARLSMSDEPAAAATVLTRALRAGMPRGLEEDARARLVEARARSGDREGASRAADEYSRRFPEGARSQEVGRWIAD